MSPEWAKYWEINHYAIYLDLWVIRVYCKGIQVNEYQGRALKE
jgi:hypothetical protein